MRLPKGFVLLALLALILAGCAGEPKREFSYDVELRKDAAQWPVWPQPPEVPRFSYAGQLIGEPNFREIESKTKSAMGGLLALLVGGRSQRKEPLVLRRPQGGTVDARGRILVTDVSQQGVFVFEPEVPALTVWESATEESTFKAPIAVVDCGDYGIFVSDAELGLVARLGRDGKPMQPFGRGLLERPTGLACGDAEGLYVADTRANQIKVLDWDGRLLRAFGKAGDGVGELNAPTYMSMAGDRLYVTDTLNARVQVFDRQGELKDSIGRRGVYVGNLTRPKGVAADRFGHVFVIESFYDHLLVFDEEGNYLLPVGGAGRAPGQFYLPAGVWTDDKGRVFVADMFNGRVAIFQYLGVEE